MNAINRKLADETAADFEALRADIDAVKRDLAAALTHLKSGAVNGTRNTADQLRDSAAELSESLSVQGKHAVKTVTDHIEQQPLTSVLIAFTAGLLLSRFLPR